MIKKEFAEGRKKHDPWTTIFLYTKKESYLLVGWSTPINTWIENNIQGPYLLRYDYWKGKEHRGSWWFRNCNINITPPNQREDRWDENPRPRYKRHFCFWGRKNGQPTVFLKLRKIPSKWIPEYDEMLKY
jgi:hypothetical protein